MSGSLGREIGGQSQFLGKFSVGFMLKRAIKNGVNVLRMDTLLQEGGQKTFCGQNWVEDSSRVGSGLRVT